MLTPGAGPRHAGRAADRPAGGGPTDVAVVGGGPVGLAIAWRCAAHGMRVVVHDPAPGSGAASVAAGMLSPVAESHFGELALTRLMLDSAARWPAFAAELAATAGDPGRDGGGDLGRDGGGDVGRDGGGDLGRDGGGDLGRDGGGDPGRDGGGTIGYRDEGTLVVGLTADDAAEAARLTAYQRELGLPITPLRPAELRSHEPLLNPRARGGAHAPDDHQVDPRRLITALRSAARRAGVTFTPAAVTDLADPDAETVVVAAGHATAALTGLPIRPVKGQIIRLRAPGGASPGFRHVIRGYTDGRQVYLVPRHDGEVVVGATVEERGDTSVTAGGVLDLLRAAVDLIPELAEYDLVEARAGLRPGTPDNAPVIGVLPFAPGGRQVVVATGHHRHGILLAPVTADLVTDLLVRGVADPALAPFAPDRFAATGPRPTEGGQRWS